MTQYQDNDLIEPTPGGYKTLKTKYPGGQVFEHPTNVATNEELNLFQCKIRTLLNNQEK